MSGLARAMLRLSACVALRETTIVGENVFDSRMSAMSFDDGVAVAGCIVVRTEQDDGEALAHQNGGPPFRPDVELVLEIGMLARWQDNGDYVVAHPETDDELELSIDAIETQAEFALFAAMTPAAHGFRIIAKRVKSKDSIRFTDPKASDKLALRYVLYKIEIDDPDLIPADPAATGIDRLPQRLRDVARAWPNAVPEKAKAALLGDILRSSPLTPLGAFRFSTPAATTRTPGSDPNPSTNRIWRPK